MKKTFDYLWTPFGYIISALSILCILPTLFLVVLPQKKRLIANTYFWQLFSVILCFGGFLIRFYHFDRRKKHQKKRAQPGIVICNHQSYTDIPVNIMTIQVPALMKKEVLKIPFIGILGSLAGAVAVDRESKKSRQKAFDQIKKRIDMGLPVQYYPEGTRNSKVGLLGPRNYSDIKSKLLHYAYEQNISVTAISLCNTEKMMRKGVISTFCKVGQIIHPIIHPKDFPNSEAFAQTCWQIVQQGHKELKEML